MTRRLPLTTAGIWCECLTRDPASGQPRTLATFDATTPGQAIRWIRVALRTITPVLHGQARNEAWHWLEAEHANARRGLNFGEPHTLTVTQGSNRITWTARPVTFLTMAHRASIFTAQDIDTETE
ncbi:hypothetical protein [Streptomyces chumphonensis]|uniref:hypothetical protein n=1 Tax=Streptomyces chumphonensis TaxID=1214925 RepID=UPI003D763801